MGKKSKAASTSTGIKPSEVPSVKNRKPLIEIPEDEQRRLIEETGILNKFREVVQDGKSGAVVEELVEERLPLADEIFNAILYIIPVSFLLMMMEMYVSRIVIPRLVLLLIPASLIHQQYRQAASLQAILDRMIPGIPSECLHAHPRPQLTALRSRVAPRFLQCVIIEMRRASEV